MLLQMIDEQDNPAQVLSFGPSVSQPTCHHDALTPFPPRKPPTLLRPSMQRDPSL
jgi:hypothetical protein